LYNGTIVSYSRLSITQTRTREVRVMGTLYREKMLDETRKMVRIKEMFE